MKKQIISMEIAARCFLITICALTCFIVCFSIAIYDRFESDYDKKFSKYMDAVTPNYNIEIDNYINKSMDSGISAYYGDGDEYLEKYGYLTAHMYYDSIKIIVHYTPHVDFESAESWEFWAIDKNGEIIALYSDVMQNEISAKTIERIKNDYKRFW